MEQIEKIYRLKTRYYFNIAIYKNYDKIKCRIKQNYEGGGN